MSEPQPFLPKKGNYKSLTAYQKAESIYDITFYFASHFLAKGDRTVDQMVQAARSGKQNIAEGSAAASTSAETEIKLTNVAKASLQELLVDYEDYLRVRGLEQWPLKDPRTKKAQDFCTSHSDSPAFMAAFYQAVSADGAADGAVNSANSANQPNSPNQPNWPNSTYLPNQPNSLNQPISPAPPNPAPLDEKIANLAITLIHQCDKCLRGYIERLEKDFVEHGGIREQMTAARLGYRNSQKDEIARLTAENAQLSADNARLLAENAGLRQRIAWLEQQLAGPYGPNGPNSPNQSNSPNQPNSANQPNQPY